MTSPTEANIRFRQTFAGSVGNLLEWYDFALFGLMAPILSDHFFPSESGGAGLIRVFGVFAAGYLARPLGGLLFGSIGDRLGRTRALTLSIWCMALPTVAMGFVPGEATVGIWAPVLLVSLRVVQGLSVGGEWVGSMIFLVETSETRRQGLRSSFGLLTISLGLALGSSVVFAVHSFVGDADWQNWGWRIPYLLGAVLAVVGIWIRRVIRESPEFLRLAESQSRNPHPVRTALTAVPRRIMLMMGAIGISTVSFTAFFIWAPSYAQANLGLDARSAMIANTTGLVTLAILTPVGGWLSDVVGYKRLYCMVTLWLTLLMGAALPILDLGTLSGALIAQTAVGALLALVQPSVVLARMFPAALRSSAMGLGYNVPQALLGGLTPVVCTGLAVSTGLSFAPAFFLLAVGAVSFLSARFIPEGPPPAFENA